MKKLHLKLVKLVKAFPLNTKLDKKEHCHLIVVFYLKLIMRAKKLNGSTK